MRVSNEDSDDLAPLEPDPVTEAYKKDVDVTLLRENLKLTPAQRLAKHAQMQRFVERFRGAANGSDSGRPKDFAAITKLELLLEERTS